MENILNNSNYVLNKDNAGLIKQLDDGINLF